MPSAKFAFPPPLTPPMAASTSLQAGLVLAARDPPPAWPDPPVGQDAFALHKLAQAPSLRHGLMDAKRTCVL